MGPLCLAHGRRVARVGDPGSPKIRTQAARGKGADRYEYNGYVFLRNTGHPDAYKNGSIMEHTVVMSTMLGRSLLPGENVHHKNGVRNDNRPENLELWTTKQPKGQRVVDQVAWAREILARYADVDLDAIG